MTIKKTYKIELYSDFKLHIVVSDDYKEAIRLYCKALCEDDIVTCDAFVASSDNHECMIFINPDCTLGTIAHESFHATCEVMRKIGCRLNTDSEEPFAYLIGYITDRCIYTTHVYENKKAKLKEIVKD